MEARGLEEVTCKSIFSMVCNSDVLCDLPSAYSAVFPCPQVLEHHSRRTGTLCDSLVCANKAEGTAGVADELELSMALCLHEAVSSMHKC